MLLPFTYLQAFQALSSLLVSSAPDRPTKVVLTNDDGWAVAQIRAQYDALKASGYNVRIYASLLLIRCDNSD